jgi:hypothetical protein
LTATTALTLDQLSGGRFLLGLGVSGPQVVEGWHGVAFGRPLARTREYVDIVRAVWRREKPVEFKGDYYQIPYTGPDATGLGWVYQYYLEVDSTKAPQGGYDLSELRGVQDWFLRSELSGVPGVAEVASIGGFVRQYQIEVSSSKMQVRRCRVRWCFLRSARAT